MPSSSWVQLAHSNAVHPDTARRLDQQPNRDNRIQVTVVLRARTPRDERRKEIQRLAARLPGQRHHLDRDEFLRRYSSSAEDIGSVVSFAAEQKLNVDEESPERRCVVLSGRIRDFDSAFGVASCLYRWNDGVYRSHDHPVHVPEKLAGVIVGVLGLDNPPGTEGHVAIREPYQFADPDRVMAEYGFPADADGGGESIGIISLGGGFHEEDIADSLAPGQRVQVVEVGADNAPSDQKTIGAIWEFLKETWAGNSPSASGPAFEGESVSRFKWTMEVSADVEIAARFADGSDIVVYFAPDTIQGKYHAFTTALVDRHSPSVLSCSWGASEQGISKNHVYLMDDVFSFAALRGVTLCFSSGDHGDGGLPAVKGGKRKAASARFPASSPHVLSCGGTMPASDDSTAEIVWFEELGSSVMASGGGVSERFGPPWWQPSAMVEKKANGNLGRGLPDVAGKADMQTGYKVTVGGFEIPIGGTSSVAPLWAALIARLNQKLGTRLGFITPLLYLHRERFAQATRSIRDGDNGAYSASDGWDACTGWGTPQGEELLRALKP